MKSYQIVEQLISAQTDSDKESILQQVLGMPASFQTEFFNGAKLALDPFITFGLRKVPEYQLDGTETQSDLHDNDGFEWNDFAELANNLNKRVLYNDSAKQAVAAAANKAAIMDWNGWYRRILTKDFPVTAEMINSVRIKNGLETLIPAFRGQFPVTSSVMPKGLQYLDVKMKFRIFAILDKDNGTIKLFTNNGKENFDFPHIFQALKKLMPSIPGSIVFDGGMVHRSQQNFMKLNTGENMHYAVFDVIPLSDFIKGSCSISQKDRVEVLSALTGLFQQYTNNTVYVVPKQIVDFDTPDGLQKFKDFSKTAADFGGVLVKNPLSPYSAGASDAWIDLIQVQPMQQPQQTSPASLTNFVKSGNINTQKGSFMTSTAILETIDAIAADKSKNNKEAMVKASAADAEFVRVLEYTYNPFKRYNIIPSRSVNFGSAIFDATTWTLLDNLHTRKITGGDARLAVTAELERLEPKSSELLWRILKKDLRAGFSESTISKAIKGLLPEFPYMRCSTYSEKLAAKFDWRAGCFSQKKADGLFANVDLVGGVVTLTTRQGSPFPANKFPQLVADVQSILKTDTQTHGEFIVRRNGKTLPREIGNGILNSVLKGGDFGPDEVPVYQVWDQIPVSAVVSKGKYEVPYKKRFEGLVAQLSGTSSTIEIIDTRVVYSIEDALKHYREMLAAGEEGTVVKDAAAIWKDGTSTSQLKLKLSVTVDLVIVGFVAGNGKNESTFGSITVQSSDGLLEVDVSGFNDADRLRLHNERDEVLGKIMAVTSNAITPMGDNGKHSLFLPRVAEAVRTDKTVADSFKSIQEQFASALKG